MNDNAINRVALDGGFLSAIKHFTKSQTKDTNIIHFRSKENGTFIVARTSNFIGSLLWTTDLSVPIEQSESALKELLEHLENTSNWKNKENVAFCVEHYVTNIM